MIGEFIERAGENTHIIVMSDHGFFVDPTTGYRFTNLNLILHHLGYLNYTQNGDIDFSNTKAFECNNNTFDWQRRLCINVENKFANGIVPSSEFSGLREQIIADLKELKNPEGIPLMNYVVISSEANSDVQYDVKRDFIDESLIIKGNTYNVKDFLTLSVESGNHYSDPVGPNGIFVWKGPNVKKGILAEIDYVDITPNLLYALGYPIAKDMDGVFRPQLFIDAKPPKLIDTYETHPKSLSIIRLDSIENDDIIQASGHRGAFSSHIDGEDQFDRACFTIPKLETFGIKFDLHLQNDPNGFTPDGYVTLDQVPQSTSQRITYESLEFKEQDKGNYNFIIPLEFNQPSYIGLWTNIQFTTVAEKDGWLTLIANGDSLNGVWPKLQIRQGIDRQIIDVNSSAYKEFSVPIKRGPIEISYINDELGNTIGEDRNVRIQNIYLSETEPNTVHPFIERIHDGFCLTNTISGLSEFEFTLVDLTSPQQLKNISSEALDLLQHVGEIAE